MADLRTFALKTPTDKTEEDAMLQLGDSKKAPNYRWMHALHASSHVNVVKDQAHEATLLPLPYNGANNWVQIMASTEV